MLSMLRTLRGRPGRAHTMPQAALVASSCIGMVSASAFASCLATYSAPSTCLRNFNPFSNSLSFIVMLLLFSFRLDTCVADHFAPLRDLGFYISGEFFPRVSDRLEALVGESLAKRGVAENFQDPFVQARDGCGRRVRGCEQPVPGRGLVAGHAPLGDRRQLGHRPRAPRAGHGDGNELARPH